MIRSRKTIARNFLLCEKQDLEMTCPNPGHVQKR
jgi:hypothetical protein